MSERPPYRVDRATLAGDLWIYVLLALDVAFGLAVRSRLPERVPSHWGLHGEVNGWSSPWSAVLFVPALGVVVYLSLLFAPVIDPRRASYALFPETLRFIRGATIAFLVGLHVLMLLGPLGVPVNMDRVVRVAMPLLFAALGNRFGRLRHNWFFGIRVPWTLESEEVWTRTHRMAGRLWVAGGLLLLPAALLPSAPGTVVLMTGVALMAVVPVVYSFVTFRRVNAGR